MAIESSERQSGQMAALCDVLSSTRRRTARCPRFPPSLRSQQGDVNIRWFRLLHSRGALFGGGISAGPCT